MNSKKKKVEVFTSGCPVCSPVVEMVQSLACNDCEVTVYDVAEQCDSKECSTKVNEYGIKTLPAVAVDGALLSCCQGEGITREALEGAGIGANR
jgi:hypothetical protein